ncbi:MAG TPA: sterol desaturase family protein [Chitinophagales bacterium]|nr:sterol desaturase family protein [Chitinophagales bacterium]
MNHLIETLNNVQPLIIIGMLLLLWTVESFIPYFHHAVNRKKHTLNNLLATLISFVVNGALGVGLSFWMTYVADHHYGLLNMISLPPIISLVAGMLMIDFYDYWFHTASHKIPFMWRWHRVHHSDTELDSTSSLRFHPFDIIAQAISWIPMFFLLGISSASFVIYFTFYIALIFLQHANIKIPRWIDKYGSYIFSTPGWHKMHHAADKKITDTHYGDVFTFWDRLFGTGGPIDINNIDFGIEYFRTEKEQSVKNLMLMPFKPVKPNQAGANEIISSMSTQEAHWG